MRTMGRSIAFLALLLFLLPALTAQEKKDADKKEDAKKVEEKKDAKDPAKKDESKDPEKKEPEKKAEEKKEKAKKKEEEKVEYGQKITTKIISMRPESNHEFTVEMQEIDPERVYQFNQWKTQRMIQIAQQTNPLS